MTDIKLDEETVNTFFADARERHAVYLRRKAGNPRPWTKDPVMRQYRITNVFRELDKTTTYLRNNIRDPLRDHPLVLPAVSLARWFNYIPSMETLFLQPSLLSPTAGAAPAPEVTAPGGIKNPPVTAAGSAALLLEPGPGPYRTPWQTWLMTEDAKELEWPLRKQGSPWVTGAYMIRTPVGMDKLEGVLSSFRNLWTQKPQFVMNTGASISMGWLELAIYCIDKRNIGDPVSLRQVWDWLKNFYGLGAFMAYEIVTDLRHTALLDRAPDINLWSNPGPGALRGANILIRGANRVRKGRLEKSTVKEAESCMAQLLELSRDPKYWPQPHLGLGATIYDPSYLSEIGDVLHNPPRPEDWPVWELHEVEMWLCETAKFVRTRLGWGRPRGNFEGI